MIIAQSINAILAMVSRFFDNITSWFSNVNIPEVWSNILPTDITIVLGSTVAVIMVMSVIGGIKKISFLLGG